MGAWQPPQTSCLKKGSFYETLVSSKVEIERELGSATVQHRLAALSSLFEYLCEKNAVTITRQRCQATAGRERGRQDSGAGLPSGPRAARSAR